MDTLSLSLSLSLCTRSCLLAKLDSAGELNQHGNCFLLLSFGALPPSRTPKGVVVSSAPGDGIYIAGVAGKGHPPSPLHGSSAVVFEDVTATGNGRNGMSLIACVDCRFARCLFERTNGTEPMAGVDLEPNGPHDALANITFTECTARGNGGGGFSFYGGQWMKGMLPALPLSVLFDRCLVDAERQCNLVPNSPGCGGFIFDLLPPGLQGAGIVVRESTVMNTVQPAAMLGGVAASGPPVHFTNCTFWASQAAANATGSAAPAAPPPSSPAAANQRAPPARATNRLEPAASVCAQPSAVDIVAGLEYVIGNILMEGIVVVAGQASSAAAPTSTLCPAVRIQGLNATIGVENITLQYSVVGTAACRVPPELPVPAAKSVRVVQQCSTTVRARCTNASNCRPELQAFLESGASSVAFGTDGTAAQDGVYTIREPGLWPKSNTAVVFEAGTMLLAARGAFVVADVVVDETVAVVLRTVMVVLLTVVELTVNVVLERVVVLAVVVLVVVVVVVLALDVVEVEDVEFGVVVGVLTALNAAATSVWY